MIEKSTIEQVLDVFFENPSREFHLRELSRIMGISMTTILSSVDTLFREKLILRDKKANLILVKANRENERFIRLKRVRNLENVYESGLADHLITHYHHPKAIILFGSYSRGEDMGSSDVDIAVISKEKEADLSQFEKKLKRKISLHHTDLQKISPEFRANLTNGILVEGSW